MVLDSRTRLPAIMQFSSQVDDDVIYDTDDTNMSFSSIPTNNLSHVVTTVNSDPQPSYIVPAGYNAVLLGGSLLIITVGLLANTAVLLIIIDGQLRKSPNSPVHTINTYITNLASADLLYIFGAIFWAVTNYDQSGWKFGEFGCRTVYFLEFLTLHASAYILTVMTIERYLAIMYPMSSLRFRNIRFARQISSVVWISAVIVALPAAVFMKVYYIDLGGPDGKKPVCAFRLGTDAMNSYLSAMAVITFIIPSILMVTVYFRMFAYIFGTIRKDSGTKTETQNPRQLKNSSRRAAKSVFVIVVVWLICFFPYWLNHFLYTNLGQYEKKMIFPMITGLLAYLNSTVNPFLYTLMPKRYNVWQRLKSRTPAYEQPMGQAY